MGVINQNSTGPISAYPAIIPSNTNALQAAILIELRAIKYILGQAFNISDSDAGLTQSMTTTDLNSVS